jgi:DNA-binding MarR family transcriptional regulator
MEECHHEAMGRVADGPGPRGVQKASGGSVTARSRAGSSASGVTDEVGVGTLDADRVRAQQLLAVLGRLGASVHEALVGRVDPGIVANVDVLVLATLDVKGTLRPSNIRELTGLSSSGVTKLLDRLEQQNLVTRDFGTIRGDKRGSHVMLTPEGRLVAGQLADGLASQMDNVRKAITELQRLVEG